MSNRLNGATLEPLTANPHPSRSIIGFGAWSWIAALLVIYGSLIPFDFRIPNIGMRFATAVNSLHIQTSELDDLVVNILLYVPLGALFALACRRSGSSSRSVLSPIAIAGCISIAVEALQIFLPARVPSILDVILNISGATVGASIVNLCAIKWLRIMDRVVAEFDHQPAHFLTIAMTCGLLLQAALPFDFVSTTSALHDVFRQASQISLGLSTIALSQASNAIVSHTAIAGWFAILGFLIARNRDHRRPGLAIATAVWRTVILVVLMEAIGLFRISHTFDAGTVFLRMLASGFGAWCAVFVPNEHRENRLIRPAKDIPLGWLLVCGAIAALTILGDQSSGTHMASGHASMASFEIRMPFEALWRSSTTTCVSTLVIGLMDYAALSVVVIVILNRLKSRRPHFWSVLLNVMIAMAMSLHSLNLHQVFDFTIPILAGFVAILFAQFTPRPLSRDNNRDHEIHPVMLTALE